MVKICLTACAVLNHWLFSAAITSIHSEVALAVDHCLTVWSYHLHFFNVHQTISFCIQRSWNSIDNKFGLRNFWASKKLAFGTWKFPSFGKRLVPGHGNFRALVKGWCRGMEITLPWYQNFAGDKSDLVRFAGFTLWPGFQVSISQGFVVKVFGLGKSSSN